MLGHSCGLVGSVVRVVPGNGFELECVREGDEPGQGSEIKRLSACCVWPYVWTLYDLGSLQQVERYYAVRFFLRARVEVSRSSWGVGRAASWRGG